MQSRLAGHLRDSVGIIGLNVTELIAASFMSSYFLVYLTDYAGLGSLGAALAPIILVVGRIFDIVNDPLQGWVIDSAPAVRFGKYRMFSLLSIILTSTATLFFFSIPDVIKTSQVLLFVWILLFYLMSSVGTSLFAGGPLLQTLTTDSRRRSRLVTGQQLLSIGMGILISFFMMLVNRLNLSVGNLGRSFSLTVIGFIALGMLISLPSLLLVREKHSSASSTARKMSRRDIVDIFRLNKAFTINFVSQACRGLAFSLLIATMAYYSKWAYCVDPATGVIDIARLGQITLVSGMASLLPMLLSALVSPPVVRWLGSSIRMINLSNLAMLITGVAMFILQIAGILQRNFIMFLVFMALLMFSHGLNAVPSRMIGLECIDYNQYRTGKSMAGMINALNKLLGRITTALSTLAAGAVLAGVGYKVDAISGNYAGDVSRLPELLNWIVIISALVPAFFSGISILINRSYPINADIRKAMAASLLSSAEIVADIRK